MGGWWVGVCGEREGESQGAEGAKIDGYRYNVVKDEVAAVINNRRPLWDMVMKKFICKMIGYMCICGRWGLQCNN